MTANIDSERFQSGADKYAAYLETAEGRLRLDLAFANVQEFLPKAAQPLRALDVGCGTGAFGVRLARLGIHVTLLDSSMPMLDFAQRAAQEARISEKIELKQGEAAQCTKMFPAGSFDLILCHNVLEFVDDPAAVLRGAVQLLRGSGTVSVLVRNRPGEVLKAAIQAGDLTAAEHNVTAEWGQEALYGGKVRLFTLDGVRKMLEELPLAMIAERGVRVVVDYLPSAVSRDTDYEQIVALERLLGRQPEFARVARYVHCLAHRVDIRMNEVV